MREMKDSGIEWIGEIPVDWQVHRIKVNFQIITGNGFPPQLQGMVGEQYPMCKASDISYADKFLCTAANSVSEEVVKEQRYNIIPGGSILFAKIGEAMKKNNRAINIIPCCIDNNCQAMVPHNINKDFGYYVFSVIDLNEFDNGGTVPCINNQKLRDYFIPYPSVDEQQHIADYLDHKCSQIDAIIARQQEVIEKLKAYKLSKINEIVVEVEGTTAHLGYVGNMKNGLNFNVVPDGETLKFLGVGDFKDHYVLDSEEMFSDILVDDEIDSDYMLQSGDIIFVRSNGSKELVGRAVMVENVTFSLSYSGFCIRFRNLRTDILNSKYLLYFFRSPYFRKQLEKYSQGSNISNINQGLLSQISIIIPPVEVQLEAIRKVEKLLDAIDKTIEGKQKIISALRRYQKSMIYEVVTGKRCKV